MPFDQTRVIGEGERALTIENDDGDRFTFEFPTTHVIDIMLTAPPLWQRGSAPEGADIWIDDARHVATAYARHKGWLTPTSS